MAVRAPYRAPPEKYRAYCFSPPVYRADRDKTTEVDIHLATQKSNLCSVVWRSSGIQCSEVALEDDFSSPDHEIRGLFSLMEINYALDRHPLQ